MDESWATYPRESKKNHNESHVVWIELYSNLYECDNIKI